ncbi:MAG TPA: hypothetical protein VFZ66_25115 [Herpetosiphonaceae bacterium]
MHALIAQLFFQRLSMWRNAASQEILQQVDGGAFIGLLVQRPLPSMLIATCWLLPVAARKALCVIKLCSKKKRWVG